MNAVEPTKKPRPTDTQFWFLLAGAMLIAFIDVLLFEHSLDVARIMGAGVMFFAVSALAMYFTRSVPVGWVALVIFVLLEVFGRLHEPGAL